MCGEETGWLIEWQAPSGARWYAPGHLWTTDASKALRFARKQDGEAFARMHWRELPAWLAVTDHVWL